MLRPDPSRKPASEVEGTNEMARIGATCSARAMGRVGPKGVFLIRLSSTMRTSALARKNARKKRRLAMWLCRRKLFVMPAIPSAITAISGPNTLTTLAGVKLALVVAWNCKGLDRPRSAMINGPCIR